VALLDLTWKQYRTRTHAADRNRFDTGVSVTPVWRDHALILEQAWVGLVKACLPPALQGLPDRLLEVRWRLRHAWIKPGGKLFTKSGNRRKRNNHDLVDGDVRRFTREAGEAWDDLREHLPEDAGMVLLACSGVLYRGNGNRPRGGKKTLEWVEMARPRWFWRVRSLEKVGVLQRMKR
jgi:hypothetical protein